MEHYEQVEINKQLQIILVSNICNNNNNIKSIWCGLHSFSNHHLRVVWKQSIQFRFGCLTELFNYKICSVSIVVVVIVLCCMFTCRHARVCCLVVVSWHEYNDWMNEITLMKLIIMITLTPLFIHIVFYDIHYLEFVLFFSLLNCCCCFFFIKSLID